jgi:hypothetical protein
MDDVQVIIVTGNPVDGFRFIGPVTRQEAEDITSDVLDDQDWWYASIEDPRHVTGQRNALGTVIGCECAECAARIQAIEQMNTGHKIQGV